MTQPWAGDAKPFLSSTIPPSDAALPQFSSYSNLRNSHRNVIQLLAWREVSPRAKHASKKLWGETSKLGTNSVWQRCGTTDARHALISWVEVKSLSCLSAKYFPLLPPPRSTIAAAFSYDGKILASTHGDHTVKVIDCETGSCLKVLRGHRRTPWVVRFDPMNSEILASGSLDHEVRLWNANTSVCIGSHDFYRPIASIAFHAKGEFLAVASGHKLYIWKCDMKGEASSPTVVLRTRRSLRAVHFHPHAAPFLLTAEVNDLDSPDSPTLATTSGYLQYLPPAVFFADISPSLHRHMVSRLPSIPSPYLFWSQLEIDEGRTSLLQGGIASGSGTEQSKEEFDHLSQQPKYPDHVIPMEISLKEPSGSHFLNEDADDSGSEKVQVLLRSIKGGQFHQFIPLIDSTYWEFPFLQGWLVGQTNSGLHALVPVGRVCQENPSLIQGTMSDFLPSDLLYTRNQESPIASSALPTTSGHSRSGPWHQPHSQVMISTGSGEGSSFLNVQNVIAGHHPVPINIRYEISQPMTAAASEEYPCTVKLRIWPHDIKNPYAALDPKTCRLIIPHAVLCSEMGAHFSPCGRLLVACVACVLPSMEVELGLQSQMQHDVTRVATSPTRHPVSAHKIIYELRVYSLEEANFGTVLASRAIRAAHCLTSIQFSPTSEHILLAYGRRHNSLLRSIYVNEENTVHIYTILEVYRVSDMEIVRVFPSVEDEVNVACFQPLAGRGLVYGTKEGKLRILQYDGSCDTDCKT